METPNIAVAVTKPGNLTVLHGTGAGLWKLSRLGTIAKPWFFSHKHQI
jgi:hypothetical protein